MPGLKEKIAAIRARRPFLDHVLRTQEHYGLVDGSNKAGAVTYFAFLSFFPILALAFAVVGVVARVWPDVQTALVGAIEEVLPGIVTQDPGRTDAIQISSIQEAAPGILSIGLPVLLYTGLGWISSMRLALLGVFERPHGEHPSLVIGKLRDLVTLALIGLVMVVSVGAAGLVRGFSDQVLELVGLGGSVPATVVLYVLTVVVGLAASAVLFFALFKLLADPEAPARSLWSGALLGAIGFELLKQLSSWLLASTKDQPAFQAFGIALILLVWINYFSRVVMYAAAWAHTTVAARDLRAEQQLSDRRTEETVQGPAVGPAIARHESSGGSAGGGAALTQGAAFGLGAASALGLVALVRRRARH